MTPNFWAPACTHPSPVAALALRPSGACQTYQSPPQPRHGACRLCQQSVKSMIAGSLPIGVKRVSWAQDSATLAGSISRWPVWASAPERASDPTGCSRLARGPRLPARPGPQVPLDCGQGGRAGSWCLGPRNVCTRPGMVGFPVRRGPPGRSEERNGRQGGSACRWPQVFHTQAIRLRPMALFSSVFNCVTPQGRKTMKNAG